MSFSADVARRIVRGIFEGEKLQPHGDGAFAVASPTAFSSVPWRIHKGAGGATMRSVEGAVFPDGGFVVRELDDIEKYIPPAAKVDNDFYTTPLPKLDRKMALQLEPELALNCIEDDVAEKVIEMVQQRRKGEWTRGGIQLGPRVDATLGDLEVPEKMIKRARFAESDPETKTLFMAASIHDSKTDSDHMTDCMMHQRTVDSRMLPENRSQEIELRRIANRPPKIRLRVKDIEEIEKIFRDTQAAKMLQQKVDGRKGDVGKDAFGVSLIGPGNIDQTKTQQDIVTTAIREMSKEDAFISQEAREIVLKSRAAIEIMKSSPEGISNQYARELATLQSKSYGAPESREMTKNLIFHIALQNIATKFDRRLQLSDLPQEEELMEHCPHRSRKMEEEYMRFAKKGEPVCSNGTMCCGVIMKSFERYTRPLIPFLDSRQCVLCERKFNNEIIMHQKCEKTIGENLRKSGGQRVVITTYMNRVGIKGEYKITDCVTYGVSIVALHQDRYVCEEKGGEIWIRQPYLALPDISMPIGGITTTHFC